MANEHGSRCPKNCIGCKIDKHVRDNEQELADSALELAAAARELDRHNPLTTPRYVAAHARWTRAVVLQEYFRDYWR